MFIWSMLFVSDCKIVNRYKMYSPKHHINTNSCSIDLPEHVTLNVCGCDAGYVTLHTVHCFVISMDDILPVSNES